MRVVVVFVLVLANLSFGVWQLYRPQGPQPDTRPMPSQAERLVLKSERLPASQEAVGPGSPEPRGGQAASRPAPSSQAPQTGVAAARDPDDSAPASPAASEPRCGAVGPFDAERTARPLARDLQRYGLQARIQPEEVAVVWHWVYLPPLRSTSAALGVAEELRSKGIEDLQVLASEDKQNAISLGLFARSQTAQRRLRQIRELGYAPELTQVDRTRTFFWVEYREPADAPLSDVDWQALVGDGRLRREDRGCR